MSCFASFSLRKSFIGLYLLNFTQGQIEGIETLLAWSGCLHYQVPQAVFTRWFAGRRGVPFLAYDDR